MPDNPYHPPVAEPATATLPPPIPLEEKTAWNAWWTWLWAITLFALWQLILSVGLIIALFATGAVSEEEEIMDAVMSISMDGDIVGVLAFSTIFFICPLCWLIGHLRKGWNGWEYLGRAKVRWWQWPLWGAITIACSILFSIIAPHLGITGPDPSMTQRAESTQFPILLYLGVGIAAPLVEEFMFRGVLYRGWRESRLGLWGTILLTSLCWAALHVQYPLVTIGYIFTLGIVLGIAREKTGSLWVPVWMHALNNGLATLTMLGL
jgi:uncharacterized protein